MTDSQPEILKFALCLFPDAQLLDFAGPMDLIGFLNIKNREALVNIYKVAAPSHAIEFTYLGPSLEPIQPTSGPAVLPTLSYDDALKKGIQFDALLVPGGVGSDPANTPPDLIRFLQAQHAGARFVMSVCTGSWALAQAGILEGRRATTNKATYKLIVRSTSEAITWVPKARWVVDGNFWTSSGVSAGIDMAAAWLEHVVGKDTALAIRALTEVGVHEQDDDEWATYWGLV